MAKQKQTKKISEKLITRLNFLRLLAFVMTVLIVGKLFYLQVIRHDYYQQMADRQHKSHVGIPAKRGTVYLNDGQNGEAAVLATDVSLDLLYIDPALIAESDHELIAEVLAEMLFEEEEEDNRYNFYDEVQNQSLDIFLSSEDFLTTSGEIVEELNETSEVEEVNTIFETREKKVENYKEQLIKRMSRKQVNYVRLVKDPSEELAEKVESKQLRGIFVVSSEVYADPTLIKDNKATGEALYELLNIPKDELVYMLRPRFIHYYPIKNRIDPRKSEKILRALEQKYILLGDKIFPSEAETLDLLKRRLILKGVGFNVEHHRYYPEDNLAAQLIGFVNKEGSGQYGLEGQFDKEYNGITLSGKAGKLLFDRDASGKQIAVGDKVLDPAIPGDEIYLTINRAVQEFVETELEKQVKEYDAERGQVIVVEVETGAILSMATYPTFNPNTYEKAFEKYEEGIYAGEYKNKIGPRAFQNANLSDIYEPGSVFKIITMAAGLDVGEVEPKTVHCEYSNFEVRDGYRIWNSDKAANGCITMTQVLARSSNLGAMWVSEKLGRTLFHKYILDFGFSDFSGIELNQNESRGWIKSPAKWADIDLAATGFGQGIAVTPLQMVMAGAALVNDGKLMKPYIISKVLSSKTGEEKVTEPRILNTPISVDTSEKIKAMMISTINDGFAKIAKVDHYFVGGKTGTSQIAKDDGTGYEEGPGSTYATFFGFAPGTDPKYAILVKIDRPQRDPWGVNVAGPLFQRTMEFILQYYGMQWEY